MEPCCALKYYPAVDACQSEKVPSITLLIKIDKITPNILNLPNANCAPGWHKVREPGNRVPR